MNGKVTFPEKKWQGISQSAKHLIERMLEVDPRVRISAKEALAHPWVKLESEEGNKQLYMEG